MPTEPATSRQRRFIGFMGVLDAALAAVSFGMGYQGAGWLFTVAAAATLIVGLLWGRGRRAGVKVPSSQDVSTPTLSRLKPIMKLREEITSLLEQHDDNPVVAVMAGDTQAEVDAIAVRSVELMDARRKVVKLSEGVYKSRSAIGRLEQQQASESDTGLRETIGKAIESRQEELSVYTELEQMAKKLDANLTEAEATLAELRSQIVRAAADSAHDSANEELDPFDSLTDRMRRLSKTMEESIETVRTGTWA